MFWGKRQRANCARVVGFKLLFFSRLPAGVKGGGKEKCGEVEGEMRDGQPLILRFLASKMVVDKIEGRRNGHGIFVEFGGNKKATKLVLANLD
jgi:hypothetical protein